jgi:NAD(P)-dependent dehydrogenase (short-subunit alcohol dehydrogenase family)
MLSDRLAGKVAIVTGSGKGIGRACALMRHATAPA